MPVLFQSFLQFSFLMIEMYSLDVSGYSKALGSLKHEHGMCCIWWVFGFHSLTASSCGLFAEAVNRTEA